MPLERCCMCGGLVNARDDLDGPDVADAVSWNEPVLHEPDDEAFHDLNCAEYLKGLCRFTKGYVVNHPNASGDEVESAYGEWRSQQLDDLMKCQFLKV